MTLKPTFLTATEPKVGIGQEIKTKGWRQWCVLSEEFVLRLQHNQVLPPSIPKESLFLVCTHSCDLGFGDPDQETDVELLAGRRTEPDNVRKAGNNPRRFQFSPPQELDTTYEILGWERYHLKRSLLLESAPDTDRTLDETTQKQLSSWLVRRYSRAAFPDAYNDRQRKSPTARKLHKGLKRLLEQQCRDIRGLYVHLEPQCELTDVSTPYLVTVICATTPLGYEENAVILEQVFGDYINNLSGCPGIVVDDGIFNSAAHISLSAIQGFSRLTDSDHLSFGGDVEDELPPDQDFF